MELFWIIDFEVKPHCLCLAIESSTYHHKIIFCVYLLLGRHAVFLLYRGVKMVLLLFFFLNRLQWIGGELQLISCAYF